jgi:hypothetical protein
MKLFTLGDVRGQVLQQNSRLLPMFFRYGPGEGINWASGVTNIPSVRVLLLRGHRRAGQS